MDIPPDELQICLNVLQRIADDPAMMNTHDQFKGLIAKIHKTGKKRERRAMQEQRHAADLAVKMATEITRTQRSLSLPSLPALSSDQDTPFQETSSAATPNAFADGSSTQSESEAILYSAIRCYICKQPYAQVHFFYHLLCPACAAFNYAKRVQRTDLTGRIALVTGGRIKIGFQIALRLLRDGASVIVTTRFPNDAQNRFHAESDASLWRNRLCIVGLDLRDFPALETFAQHLLDTRPHLDILINNAAQTIKRPSAFYQHLREGETRRGGRRSPTVPSLLPAEAECEDALPALTQNMDRVHSAPVLLEWRARSGSELKEALNAYFPSSVFDSDGQPLDMRPTNSWSLKLNEVSTAEMLEVHLVNAVAPFLLNGRLKPLFLRSPFACRFIVNVSAMEGQFSRDSKTPFHPHTNMAKAALNMMTRTSAADYALDGIYMNSVDTGWITDENPHPKKVRLQTENGFYTPLDVIDGMARLYDPIAQGVTNPETPLYGHFLKNYAPYDW